MNETTLTNSALAELLLKLANDEQLSPVEEVRASAHANRLTNQWLSGQVAFSLGLIQPDYFSALQADVQRTVAERPTLRRPIEDILTHYPGTKTMETFEPFFADRDSS